MSFSIKPGKPIRRELKHVARHQLQRARGHLEPGAWQQHVHDARKNVKKARAIVKLLRQAETTGLRKDGRQLRAAGRLLSKLRDADVVLETLAGLSRAVATRVPEHTLAAMRRDLIRARAQCVADAIGDACVAQAADTLRAVRRSAADWKVPAIEPLDLPNLVKDAYRAARKSMRRAQRTSRAADLHAWRKRVKALWYQLRLIEGWAPSLETTIAHLDQLETLLGEHHDLFVLQTVVAKAGPPAAADARTALSDVAKARQGSARRRAFALGRRVLADKPRRFARALRDALSPAASGSAPSSTRSASPAA